MATSYFSFLWSNSVGARIAFYPSLLYGCLMTSSNRRWYDRVDDKVILGALPFHKTAIKLVNEEKISGVVSLNEPYELRYFCPSQEKWKDLGVEQLHLPTVDYNNAPSLENINKGIDFIEKNSSSVYIHCKAGRSRSTTLVVCYMIKKYNLPPEKAIELVKEKRPHILLGLSHYKKINEFWSNSPNNQ